MTLSRAKAKRLVDDVLAQASFGDVRVRISAANEGHLRYGAGRPTTSGDVDAVSVAVTASKDGRTATVTGSRTDTPALAQLVARAEGLAMLSPKDPEYMPPLDGSGSFVKVKAEDKKVATLAPQTRADLVGRAIRRAEGDGVSVAGLLSHEHRSTVLGTRAGLFAHHSRTQVSLSATCRTPDGSGSARAGYVSHTLGGLVPELLVQDASERAKRSQLPARRDPGTYPVILAPQAVADLLSVFVGALGARRADEGRSAFSRPGGGNLVGDKLFDERISLWSDPADKENPASPFAGDGRPHTKVSWVEKGVLSALHNGRFWADKQGLDDRPSPSSLHMAGTDDDLDALVAGLDRGVLISRLWYIRMLDPQQLLVTGLTRDGTFWVEGGKVVEPIRNFRFNDSPLTLLTKATAIGRPQRAGLSTGRVMVVPPVAVSQFELSSVSDAV